MASTVTALTSGGGIALSGDTSGSLQLQTNNGTTAMTIDTSQNVGIGTTSPTLKLDVNGASILRGTTNILTSTTGNVTAATWSDNATDTGYLGIRSSGGVGMWAGGYLAFGSGSNTFTERMRITSAGDVIIAGTTQRSAGLVSLDINPASRNGITFYPTTNAGIDACRFLNNAGTQIGYISCSSTSTAYSTSSDYRLKENIAPMQNALGVVAKLKPVTYTWKSTGEASQGFIAHELQEVVPDCVTGEKDAVDEEGKPVYQGIDTSFLVATLTKAIQEQQAIITDLKARIETLEGAKA